MIAIRVVASALVLLASGIPFLFAPNAYGGDSINAPSAASVLDEQRLAARFDPQKIREREAAHWVMVEQLLGAQPPLRTNSAGVASPISGVPVNGISQRIDGSRNPELFMPYEVFDELVTGVSDDPSQRTAKQALYHGGLRKAGVEDVDQFWAQVEQIARPYLALRKHLSESPLVPAATPEEAANIQLCKARFAALTDARLEFSADRFDDILYTAIAPSLHLSTFASSLQAAIEDLRSAARGCQ
jgi:hypothetical protein